MMPRSSRVLLIDDDRKLSRLLVDFMRSNGLDAAAEHEGASGLERALREEWDLVVLDVMLPEMDGYTVLRRLRAESSVPVLMLTSRGGEDDRVQGLEEGADDYLAKTASSRELLARIRALLRRSGYAGSPRGAVQVQIGELHVDMLARRVCMAGREVGLTPVEYDLLAALVRARGEALSREQLLDRIRDRAFDPGDRSIDVHISALRRKLGEESRMPRYVETVRGYGYRLRTPLPPA